MNRMIFHGFLLLPLLCLSLERGRAQEGTARRQAAQYTNRAIKRLRRGELDEAIEDCNTALRLRPDYYAAYACRGGARLKQAQYDSAIRDFTQAIYYGPKDAYPAYTGRGMAWRCKGDGDRAIRDYYQAIRLNPIHGAEAYNALAWAQATFPSAQIRNGKEAIENARRACRESDWKNAKHLGTLAAAYAEAGDFAEAVSWQEKSLLLIADGRHAAAAERRLELYRAGRPYREPAAAVSPRRPTRADAQ